MVWRHSVDDVKLHSNIVQTWGDNKLLKSWLFIIILFTVHFELFSAFEIVSSSPGWSWTSYIQDWPWVSEPSISITWVRFVSNPVPSYEVLCSAKTHTQSPCMLSKDPSNKLYLQPVIFIPQLHCRSQSLAFCSIQQKNCKMNVKQVKSIRISFQD